MKHHMLLAAVLAGLAMAGCVAQSGPSRPTTGESPIDVWRTESQEGPFGWSAAVGVPTTGTDAQFTSINAIRLSVGANATRLYVNVTWTCTASLCPLDLWIYPDAKQGNPQATGQGPHRVVIEAPREAAWTAELHGSINHAVAGVINMTALYHGPAPE